MGQQDPSHSPQEVDQVHTAPHPPLWGALRGVCALPQARGRGRPALLRAGARLLPGEMGRENPRGPTPNLTRSTQDGGFGLFRERVPPNTWGRAQGLGLENLAGSGSEVWEEVNPGRR